MLTLEQVRRDPRIQPTYIPALQGVPSQLHRVQIRKLIQSVCSSGGVSQPDLEESIAKILCESDLNEEIYQVKLLESTVPHVRERDVAYEMGQELKHLDEDVHFALSSARQIVTELLDAGFLVTTGSAVVVCAGFPLEPAH
jgi:hypothetical protein